MNPDQNPDITPDRLIALHEMERKHVRFDPTVNMGHIISMGTSLITTIVFVMVAWSTLDKRIVVLEEARSSQLIAAQERQVTINEKFSDLKGSMAELKASVEAMRSDLRNKERK